jgi:hypothetical protein
VERGCSRFSILGRNSPARLSILGRKETHTGMQLAGHTEHRHTER